MQIWDFKNPLIPMTLPQVSNMTRETLRPSHASVVPSASRLLPALCLYLLSLSLPLQAQHENVSSLMIIKYNKRKQSSCLRNYFHGWRERSSQAHWLLFQTTRVRFPAPHGSSRPSVASVPGDPMLFSELYVNQACMWHTYIHLGKTLRHVKSNK